MYLLKIPRKNKDQTGKTLIDNCSVERNLFNEVIATFISATKNRFRLIN